MKRQKQGKSAKNKRGLRTKILRHIRRTGVGPGELLRTAGLMAPDGSTDWRRWSPTHVAEVMLSEWEALPDRCPSPEPGSAEKEESGLLTATQREAPCGQTDGTGVTPHKSATQRLDHRGEGSAGILRGVKVKPGGWTADTSRSSLRVQVRRHIRRTGVGPDELLRKAGLIAPDDPRDWSKWPYPSVKRSELHVMLVLLEALPDRARLRNALVPPMPGKRPRVYKKRLRLIELEHYARFQEQVQNILPLPGKKINELFRLLLQNGGRFSQAVRASQFAGLTEEEAVGIENAYLRTL